MLLMNNTSLFVIYNNHYSVQYTFCDSARGLRHALYYKECQACVTFVSANINTLVILLFYALVAIIK